MAIKDIRGKGANGEREAIKWFIDRFEIPAAARNLEQTRGGGADCLEIPYIALEIKRQEILSVPAWWRQTVNQAVVANRIPVLMYRQNRKPWHFGLPASLIIPASWDHIIVKPDVFIAWYTQLLDK